MALPVTFPVLPMLAKRVAELPEGDGWIFEPKWDGFRTLVFRDGDEILIQSRESKPLNRYFPEVEANLLRQLPPRCVLDGEIVIAAEGRLDFDALQLRVHPAASRVKLLAEQTPASVVFFDLLCLGDADLRERPFGERSGLLGEVLARVMPPVHQTPRTRDPAVAADWFRRFEGAGLDGVMAKSVDGVYEPNKRTMLKVKHERDCDCVVAGFRWHKDGEGEVVGSLLLGLYDAAGALQHVGVCASFPMAQRRELVAFLAPYRERAAEDHPWGAWNTLDAADAASQRMPGGVSRWNSGKTFPGCRYARSWCSRLRTSICRETASATWRSSDAGARISHRPRVPMSNSKWSRRPSSPWYSRPGGRARLARNTTTRPAGGPTSRS